MQILHTTEDNAPENSISITVCKLFVQGAQYEYFVHHLVLSTLHVEIGYSYFFHTFSYFC